MAAKQGNADRVLAILKKGQRLDCRLAQKRLGLGVVQYQRAIKVLKERGYEIDSDPKVVVERVDGKKVRRWIASHQLIASPSK